MYCAKTVKNGQKVILYLLPLLQHSTYVNSTLGVAAIKKNASLLTKTLAKETHRNRLTNDMNHWHSVHLQFWQQKMTSFLIDQSSKFLWNVCSSILSSSMILKKSIVFHLNLSLDMQFLYGLELDNNLIISLLLVDSWFLDETQGIIFKHR